MVQVSPQATPNPLAFKFTLEGHTFAAPVSIRDAAAAEGTPFAALFKLPGVAGIFATANFVTVTKTPAADWGTLADLVKEALEKSL